jgi:HTH-type transcriptional regulator/antitoxin HigA
MTTHELLTIQHVWPTLAPLIFVPQTESEYQRLVATLDAVIDQVGEQESHPLASLMDILSVLIEQYEDDHVPELV